MLLTPWIQTNIDRVVVTRIDAEDKTAKANKKGPHSSCDRGDLMGVIEQAAARKKAA
jgi:hypothetical protein